MSWTYLKSATPLAMAHRGGALEAPENTMQAFENAVNLGFQYLELDVRATSDAVLAVYHDPTLDTLTDRSGAIEELTWNEVKQAKVDGLQPIPRLEDVLDTWPEIRINIDPKHSQAVKPLVAVLEEHDCVERVCLSTFSDWRMRVIQKLLDKRYCTAGTQYQIAKFRTESLLRRPSSATTKSDSLKLARVGSKLASTEGRLARAEDLTEGCVQVPATIHGRRLVDARFVDTVHSHGCQVHVWTVNDAVEMRDLLELGVDGIMTDRPSELKAVLAELGQWRQ